MRFHNTPIRDAHFSSGDDWDEMWNNLVRFPSMNVDSKFTRIKVSGPNQLLLELLKVVIRNFKKRAPTRQYLFEVESMHWFTDFNPYMFTKFKDELLSLFNPPAVTQPEELVLHLRRGDDLTAPVRYESDAQLIATLGCLKSTFPGKRIRIYSNAGNQELADLCGSDVILDSETDPFSAIAHMAKADVLVIAKSSMSYVAALLSNGAVFSPEFWHPRVPGWKSQSEICIRGAD